MLLSLLLSVLAFAGDSSTYVKLGFSADGKYYAFGQMGQQDGSGFYYADASVVDVAANKIVAKQSFTYSELNDRDEVQGSMEGALNKAVARVNLAKYKIVRGKILGEDVIVRPATDLSQYTSTAFTVDPYWPNSQTWKLNLVQKDAEDKSQEGWCGSLIDGKPQMFKLSLIGTGRTEKTVVLQDDQKLPKSRGECIESYGIAVVTVYKDALAINVSYQGPGFEGPDVRQMVVTGKVDLE